MIKFFFLICLLLMAYGFAVLLLRRLTDSRDRLIELHEQMARNDAQLREQMHRLSELQEAQAAQNAGSPPAPPNSR